MNNKLIISFLVVLALLLALALYGYLSGRWEIDEARAATVVVPPSKYDQRLLDLEREAIDSAYRHKIEQLFTIWLSDDTEQPARAVKGAQNARRAYIGAMNAIERRQAEQQR